MLCTFIKLLSHFSKLKHVWVIANCKIQQILEILNGCNSETMQIRVRYVLTKFQQNLWRVSILRVDLTWNDPYMSDQSYCGECLSMSGRGRVGGEGIKFNVH